MPLRSFMIHGKRSKYQYKQEFERSWFHPSWTTKFMTSVGEVTADVVETARELEVELDDLTELLQSHD